MPLQRDSSREKNNQPGQKVLDQSPVGDVVIKDICRDTAGFKETMYDLFKKVTDQTGGLSTLKVSVKGNLSPITVNTDGISSKMLLDTEAETSMIHKRAFDYEE